MSVFKRQARIDISKLIWLCTQLPVDLVVEVTSGTMSLSVPSASCKLSFVNAEWHLEDEASGTNKLCNNEHEGCACLLALIAERSLDP